MPRRNPGECRLRPGRAPIYRCTVALPGLCWHSPGLHLDTTSDNQGVAVALPGSVWAPVELRCRPGCSRCHTGCSQCRAGCSRCRAGRCRSFPVHSGGIKHLNTFPLEPQLSPVHPGRPRWSPGSSR
ncbi:hypothetical protein DPMN_023199 [Dreissena polymorpha]|uniref:Uncharacterized protein n=1 Tax=Dreissena polymorpha TaxID=45954 RepID=A0A9D4LKM6_DREPO|nr:hypothetical protein DPMN_023199 [Dreissena polymorpha]